MMMKNVKMKIFLCWLCLLAFCTIAFAQKISDPFAKKYHNPFRRQIDKIIDLEDKIEIYKDNSNSEEVKKLRKELKKEKEKFLKMVNQKKEKTQKEVDAARKNLEKAGDNVSKQKSAQKVLDDREKYLRYIDIWANNEDPYELEKGNKAALDAVSFLGKEKDKKKAEEKRKEEKKEAREEKREEKREAKKKAKEDKKEKGNKKDEKDEKEDESEEDESEETTSESEEKDY